MLYTTSHQDFEHREILAELAADVATLAGIVRDEGRNLSAEQRGDLELLVRAARRVKQSLGGIGPQFVFEQQPMPCDALAYAMEATA